MTPSIENLKHALEVSEQIQKLEAELATLLGPAASTTPAKRRGRPPGKQKKKKKGKMSAQGLANIRAAQKARWARVKRTSATAKSEMPAKKKREMSSAHRAAIVAAQKIRWAKFHAGK